MTNQSKLTACVVGAGFIGPAHIEALRRNGVEVRALVADGGDEARRRAADLNIPQWYSSLEEALASSGADVYHLAVPNALHAPYSAQVLRAGRSVVCEKPLALTVAESAELVELARSTGQVAAVSYNLRFYPQIREARERIRVGSLGRIHAVHGTYLQDWLLYDTDWNWRLDPARGGPLRAVADIGTHWLDVVTYATGLEVTRVFADFSTVHPVRSRPRGPATTFGSEAAAEQERDEVTMKTEDQAAIVLRLSNGAIGSLLVSQVSAGRKNTLSFEVDGGDGSLAWNSEDPNHLWLGHRKEPNQLLDKDPALLSAAAKQLCGYPGGHQEGYPDTFRQFFLAVYAAVAAGPEARSAHDFPTFEDGHREMVTCAALLESAQTGRWVELPQGMQ